MSAAPGSAPPARSPVGLTASCSRRQRKRRRRGVAATAGTSGGSWCLGRPAPGSVSEVPVGAAGGRRADGLGRRAGARGGAQPPSSRPRRPLLRPLPGGPDCQRRPRAGMRRQRRRRAGGRRGGPGAGRGWGYLGGSSGAGHPPPNGGGPEPAGLGFSWGASPAKRPGALGAPARCRHAWPHAAQLGRAGGAATQLLGPRPGP